MNVNEYINIDLPINSSSKHESRSFEASENIEITKKIVKFGSSVYQFKNVTGFKVGRRPKSKIPFFVAFVLALLGIVAYLIGNALSYDSWLQFGQCSIALAALIAYVSLVETPSYGLSLSLNSGEEKFFVSTDKEFLMKVVNTLYDFMTTERDSVVNIDMSNRSVRIRGNSTGPINLGDGSRIHSTAKDTQSLIPPLDSASKDSQALVDFLDDNSYRKLLDILHDSTPPSTTEKEEK
jgi:hypothetical protein